MKLDGISWILLLFFVGVIDLNLAARTRTRAKAGQQCPTIKMKNGRARIRSRGRSAQFRCWRDYTLIGDKMAICLKTKQWSKPTPICVGKQCPKLDLPDVLSVKRLHGGGVLQFMCQEGYIRQGPERIYCQGKKWNMEPPTCHAGMSLGCDFETGGLCGWSQVIKEDEIDWIRQQGATPSKGTGPQNDNTLGTSEGHYLFIESSSPVKKGNRAQLISPKYRPSDVIGVCMEFYYHMFGTSGTDEVGSLEVFLKPDSIALKDLQTNDDVISLFGINENQGEEWHRQKLMIPTQNQPFQFVFQATKKAGWLSDIAIDDIRLFNCTEDADEGEIITAVPPQPTSTTTQPPTTSKRKRMTTKRVETTTKRRTATTTSQTTTKWVRRRSTTPAMKTTRPTTKMWVRRRSTTTPHPETTRRRRRTTTTPETTTRRRETTTTAVTETSTLKRTTTPSRETTMKKRMLTTETIPFSTKLSSEQEKRHNLPNSFTSKNNNVTPKIPTEIHKVSTSFDFVTNDLDLHSNSTHFDSDLGNGSLSHMDPDTTYGRSQRSGNSASSSTQLLPLIIGVAGGVVLVGLVVAVLAYKLTKKQRLKEEKDMEEQLDIMSDYVENNQ